MIYTDSEDDCTAEVTEVPEGFKVILKDEVGEVLSVTTYPTRGRAITMARDLTGNGPLNGSVWVPIF